MSYTPGPWEVVRHNHVDDELWLSINQHADSNGMKEWIAEIKYLITEPERQWANARLIATAPELLDALIKLTNESTGFLAMADADTHGHTNMTVLRERIQLSRAIIAKAQGEEQ